MTPMVVAASGLSVVEQLALLQIPKSSYYWNRTKPVVVLADPLVMVLCAKIHAICLDDASYGYRRVTKELHSQGFQVNHKRVKRLMKEDNLLCLRRKAFVIQTTDSAHAFRIYPNLARDLALERVNQLWVSDITYIRLDREFIFLAVVLDAYSRRIVGWGLSRTIDTSLTLIALTMAIQTRSIRDAQHQLTHHSDRGVQYASSAYVECLEQYNITISMSRKGNPYDNAKAESFMKTLKQEEVYMNEYESLEHAKENIEAFLQKYNHRRLHSALGYVAPAMFENHTKSAQLSSTLTSAFPVQ